MNKPKYQEIADDLRRRIAAKEWSIGEMLPSIQALMETYSVSGLNTVRAAQAVLVAEGVLRPEHGRGVRIVALPKETDAESAADLIAEIRRLLTRLEAILEPNGGR